MAFTYSKLAEVTLASSASSIDFTNIPQNYDDLKIVMSSRLTVADVDNVITLNGSTTKSSGIRLYGNGSNQASDTAVGGGLANPSIYTANTFGNTEYYFPNYRSSNSKTVSIDATTENNDTQSYQNLSAQLFNLTTVITSIKLTPNSGSYVANSTAYLYGVKAEV